MGYLIDPASPSERETAEQLNHQLVARAQQLGGTCTGEHAMDMMRTIKQALDPLSILSPEKIFLLQN